jgi:uncharacterized protein YjbI with pentapeptide repeats
METLIEIITNGYAIVTVLAAIVIFIFQYIRNYNERYKQYASDLYREDNQTAQITSAILLRSYLTPNWFGLNWSYVKSTLNLIAAILRHSVNGNLQKTLADSVSYVSKADGQDFQHANMYRCSIKPKSRIEYEITGNEKLLDKRLSLRCADFYKANISQSGLYSINADCAVFYESLLYGSTFHNCILTNADFRSADVHNLKFKDCELMGANFAGARRLDTVKVYDSKKSPDGESLLSYLNNKGVFVGRQSSQQYVTSNTSKKIFISKLGAPNTKQKLHYTQIKEYLQEKYKYQFDFIDPEDYRDSGQIEMIVNRMSECSGVLIFAFSYIHINEGNMVGVSNAISNEEHISPWLQIEAALANALYKLPCMIIAEDGVRCNGIFDENVINNEDLMFKINYTGTLSSLDEESLQDWSRLVDRHSCNK